MQLYECVPVSVRKVVDVMTHLHYKGSKYVFYSRILIKYFWYFLTKIKMYDFRTDFFKIANKRIYDFL